MILPWEVLCCQTKNRCKIRQPVINQIGILVNGEQRILISPPDDRKES